MTALTIPRHQRDGCLYEFPPDARAALLHQAEAARASLYMHYARESATDQCRQFYRNMARDKAAEARRYFAQWQGAK